MDQSLFESHHSISEYRKMKTLYRYNQWLVLSVAALVLGLANGAVLAASAHEIDRDADAALANLYESTPVAKQLAEKAKGILIFPSIIKAGLMIGGQYGDGVLRQQGKSTGYYNSSAVSYGLQAGAQSFGYVMFFMTAESLDYLNSSDGWEIGVGPTVVVVDEGLAKTLTTTTAQDDIYAIIFGQKGLMAGLGIQGSKITKIDPGK
jgi:lipid-binding SYLF domain-containing protein